MTWKAGDPLPDNELWTWAMVEQFAKRSRWTLRRKGLTHVPGMPGLFDPRDVRRLFSRDFDRVGVYTQR